MDLGTPLDNRQNEDSKTNVKDSLPMYVSLGQNRTRTHLRENSQFGQVLKIIRDNLAGCDFLMCLFMAALHSYRVDRCLRPFPTSYACRGNKNIEKLRTDSELLPSLQNVLASSYKSTKEQIEIMEWVFLQKDQPQLRQTSVNNIEILNGIKPFLRPHLVFEVIHPLKSEEIWTKRRTGEKTFLAYHGSQIDNFYSILKVGLQQNFSTAKELLYGKGIYLTTDLTLGMTYAPFGHSWKHSMLGNKHSIIAVCEIIDDIKKVKLKDDNFKNRAVNEGSISGKIPEKYLVVTDSQMVRLKYLLIYKEKTLPTSRFWTYNLALIFSFAYVFCLFCIGFFQGPNGTKLIRQWRKLFNYE